MRATVIADASFCSTTKAAGWAVWVAYDGGAKEKRSGVFRDRPPNSGIAELQAALNGIWLAYQHGARDILIQTDCESVVHAIKGANNAYGALWRDARDKYFPQAVIRARHVRGHTRVQDSRSWCNRWADAEAKRHMRTQREELIGVDAS